jgi:DNA-binding GntR family transcriptional regulator
MTEDQHPSTSAAASHPEEEIARLAYRYYEEEGRPEGRAEEHWRRAAEEFHGPIPPWTVESGAGDA